MDISTLVSQQKILFNSNKSKETSFRIAQLRKFKKALKDNESSLYEAIYEDFGKSQHETYLTEFSLLYEEVNNCIKNLKRWSKRKRVRTNLANFPAKSYIVPEPLGVILVIGAWNYPYQLSLIPAITALAAGNTVILKPSELPSRSSAMLAQLVNEHFDADYFCVVEGGVSVTSELLAHRFDKIFFTGSIPIGRIVYEAAAKNLTPVTLELGGKSPTFVMADADIKMTAKRLVWAKFLNAGQTCVAPDYILVHEDVKVQLLEAMKNEIIAQYNFSSGLPDNYTRIINEKNFDRLYPLIDADKLYYGGVVDRKECVIQPTILSDVNFNDAVMQDEIFGPILPVISFLDLNVVVSYVKSQPKPLSCYIYSKDSKIVDRLVAELSFGGGCVNDSMMHLTNSRLPFGGVGFSGIGNYHGKAGFDNFTHFKSIMHKSFLFEANLKYAPYSIAKLKLAKRLFE